MKNTFKTSPKTLPGLVAVCEQAGMEYQEHSPNRLTVYPKNARHQRRFDRMVLDSDLLPFWGIVSQMEPVTLDQISSFPVMPVGIAP